MLYSVRIIARIDVVILSGSEASAELDAIDEVKTWAASRGYTTHISARNVQSIEHEDSLPIGWCLDTLPFGGQGSENLTIGDYLQATAKELEQ